MVSQSKYDNLKPQPILICCITAGLPIEKVFGSATSVYTGCFTNDWQQLSLKDSEICTSHTALGIEASMNANRISWFFNFKGTSFNVDSACSSSLVALDLACKSLIAGDTEMVRQSVNFSSTAVS